MSGALHQTYVYVSILITYICYNHLKTSNHVICAERTQKQTVYHINLLVNELECTIDSFLTTPCFCHVIMCYVKSQLRPRIPFRSNQHRSTQNMIF